MSTFPQVILGTGPMVSIPGLPSSADLSPLGVYNVKHYSAKGDGVTDDTTAIQDAITAAATTGGMVLFPSATYVISNTLTLPSNVYLIGLAPQVGLTAASTAEGAVLVPAAGLTGKDAIVTSASANFCGLVGMTLRNCGSSGGWAVHVLGSTGFIMRDCAIEFDAFANGRGLFLDGGTQNVLGARVDNVSIVSGNGFTGAVGFQFGVQGGGAGQLSNACLFSLLQVIGFVSGVICSYGGGNTFISPWVQSCTTGFTFDAASLTNVFGGWLESNTTNLSFTINGLKNAIRGIRWDGTGTFANGAGLTNASQTYGNRIAEVNGYNPVGKFTSQPAVPANGVGMTNSLGADATVHITGGTVTAIAIGQPGAAQATGLTSGTFRVGAGEQVVLTYSVAPTWVWFGD